MASVVKMGHYNYTYMTAVITGEVSNITGGVCVCVCVRACVSSLLVSGFEVVIINC